MSKGPDAFRTISEVAEELKLPQHVLRFWETRFAQIRPLKRGGGRRYYRPDDVDLLRGIRRLLYGEGYTIRGVQRILHEQGPRFVVSTGRGQAPDDEAAAVNGAHMHDTAVSHQTEQDSVSAPGRIEPSFDPRDFRAIAAAREPEPAAGKIAVAERLSSDEVHRLQSTLSELLELKRLLDQVR